MGFSVRLRVGLLGGMVVDVLVLDATSVAFFFYAISLFTKVSRMLSSRV